MTTTTEPPEATLENLDPADLIVSKNIRKASVDAAFVASIKQLGVLAPIVAVRNDDGNPVIRMGHRRQLGAIKAGLKQVPVMIVSQVQAELLADAEARRILEQLAENDDRLALTAAEQAGAIQTLLDLNLTEADIAKRTSFSKDHIAAAQAVSNSQLAAKATAKYPALTLEHGAALAEFEGDSEAVKKLTVTAIENPSQFQHQLQRLRDERARAQRVQDKISELKKAKVKIANQRQPAHYDNNLTFYADAEGKQLTEETHRVCPGHIVTVAQSYRRDNDVEVVGYCTDPKKYGHKRFRQQAEKKQPMSDAEKAERRTVLANNKAWRSAEQVRRRWLRDFSARQTPPDDGLWWAMNEIAFGEHRLTSATSEGHQYARLLLNLPHRETRYGTDSTGELRELIERAKPGRRAMILLTLVLGAYEGSTSVQTWRSSWGNGWDVRYFKALAAWGYPLSDVEQIPINNAEENERKRAEAIAELETLRAEHDEPCIAFRYSRVSEYCAGCGWSQNEHLKRDLARAEADEADEVRKLVKDPDAENGGGDDLGSDPLDEDLVDDEYED